MTVRDTDRGYKALMRKLLRQEIPHISVGIHGEEAGGPAGKKKGAKASGMTVGEVATIHEFGVGNHPERSFIRAWFDGSKAENAEAIHKIASAVLRDKRRTWAAASKRAALLMQARCQQFIRSGMVSPKTDKDGTTLIDTGHLVNAILGKVEK